MNFPMKNETFIRQPTTEYIHIDMPVILATGLRTSEFYRPYFV